MTDKKVRHDILEVLSGSEWRSVQELKEQTARDISDILLTLNWLHAEHLIECSSRSNAGELTLEDMQSVTWRRLPSGEKVRQSMEQHEWET
jgi:predicted transcriptional regulator